MRHLSSGPSRRATRAAIVLAALAAGAFATSSAPPARADVTVHIDIGNAPPPPRFAFRGEPHLVYVPEERVYVIDDPDFGDNDGFRYGSNWYVFRDGYWYRANRWRGPFTVIQPRYVPGALYRVPPGHWKHRAYWVPPGQAKKMEERREDRGHGKGHGRGHGKHGDSD